jgi:hypothetical protein
MDRETMNQSTLKTVLLGTFGLVSIVAGVFLLTQTETISAGEGRQRLVVAGGIAVLLGGILLYEGIDR